MIRDWRTAAERVAPRAAAALVCLTVAGCGRVEFVPAPFTPTHVELAYSKDEDLTRLRWQVPDATGLTFELATGGSFVPIDFAVAPYPSGSWSCGEATCFQLVLRGRFATTTNGYTLRSHHASLGDYLGLPATSIDAPSPGVQLTAALAADDTTYQWVVDDWLDAPGLHRALRLTVWPEPTAPCVDRADVPDDPVTASVPGTTQQPFTAALTDEGRYCLRVRTQPQDGGAAIALEAPLLTQPDTFREETDFTPPAEVSPVVWFEVNDLEIVDPDRCTTVENTVHDTFAQVLGGAASSGAVVDELMPPVELSPMCMQSAARSLDAGPLADRMKQYLASNFTQQYHRPILLYVNNLDAPLPQSLTDSLTLWESSFDGVHLVPLDIVFGAPGVLSTFPGGGLLIQFTAIEDPQFVPNIKDKLSRLLPFKSQLHDPAEIEPLMPAATVQQAAGEPWKVCQASPAIARVAGTTPIPDSQITSPIDPANPPGFTVTLPQKILVPGPQFMSDTVVIRYEICRRWCSHPFVDMAGAMEGPWDLTSVCVKDTTQ